MGVTVLKSPNSFAPGRNELEYKLEGTSYIIAAGSKASGTITFNTSYPTDGQTIQIAWSGNSFTFTFADSPSGLYELHTNSGAAFDFYIDWVIDCMQKLAKIFDISQDFELLFSSSGASNGVITFNARKKGTAYNLTFTEAIAPITTSTTAGVNRSVQPNFKIRIQPIIEETLYGDDWVIPDGATKDLPPDANAEVLVDMRDTMRGFLSEDIPVLSPVQIRTMPNSMKRYYCRGGEYYGSTPSMQDFFHLDSNGYKYLVNAGVGREKEYLDNFDDYFRQQDCLFLTNMPRTILAHKDQPIFLSCYAFGAADQKVIVNIYYDDGSLSTHDVLLTTYQGNAYILSIPVGYTQLNLASLIPVEYSEDNVVAWDVQFKRQSTEFVYSEVFTFELNKEYYPENHFFLFRNSLGGWDPLWCAGDVQMNSEVVHDLLERKVDNTGASTLVVNPILKFNTEFNNSRAFETNYRDIEYVQYLKDLIATERIFKIESNVLHEGIITTDSADLGNSSEFVRNFAFEFTYGKEVGL